MHNIPAPALIFGGLVVALWVICFVFRMCSGSRSSRAVRQLADYSERMEARNARVDALNGIFRDALRGERRPDRERLRACLQEYADYAARCRQDEEQWRRLMEEARSCLENLRISQNMLGGRNDLAAIPYYTRCGKYNRLLSRYNLHRTANFDVELVRQVKRLLQESAF